MGNQKTGCRNEDNEDGEMGSPEVRMEICPFDFEGFSSLHLIWVAVSDAPSSD
jgi:hypothetical protein